MANGDPPTYSLRWLPTPATCGNCGEDAGWGVVGAREICHSVEPLCDNCTMRLAPQLCKALIAIQVLREVGEMVQSSDDPAWLDRLAMWLNFARDFGKSCQWPLRIRFIAGALDLGAMIDEDEPVH